MSDKTSSPKIETTDKPKHFPVRINRKDWAGLSPNGIGKQKPNHYLEMAKTIWENRDNLPYAWRILSRGVCDGCALGVAGLRDWTMPGPHLCSVRLNLLRLSTMSGMDETLLGDAESLRKLSSKELRQLGRLPYPMRRREGEKGFKRISWDEAYAVAAEHIRKTSPQRLAFYLTSRGVTNEVYYVAQKAVRFLGSNNIDNAARICHAPSTVALNKSLGAGASSVSYTDWIGSDLLVFVGSNVANDQPITTKYMYYARQQGTKIVAVNTYREPGMERYWIPSAAESAVFGTKLTDEFFMVHTGGDLAFFNGVLKELIERDDAGQSTLDHEFIQNHTEGFEEVLQTLREADWSTLVELSGSTREEINHFADLCQSAKNGILVWSMGVTQHTHGVDTVHALINLALARGWFGRQHAGMMPIRGHSGVQGGAEIEVSDGFDLDAICVQSSFDWPSQRGTLRVRAAARGEFTARHKVRVVLEAEEDARVLHAQAYAPEQLKRGIQWDDLEVQLWHPNGSGQRSFYVVRVQLVHNGRVLQEEARRVGFKSIEWRACRNAPPEADPWLCVINGTPTFLQGVNWTPIVPNFADLAENDYRLLLEQYQQLGCNLLRVWGGAFLEKTIFYELCDELGILVWQEFPLSSSGLENWPPEDESAIEELCHIASTYIDRRSHHASLLMWCGGNELQGALDGNKCGIGKPVDNSHPLMAHLEELVATEDPTHRFVPSSSSGPRFMADAADFGRGLHWDVHGPWNVSGSWNEWKEYWKNDDALFRSETGCPGASGADVIQHFAGELPAMPATLDNPLWRRSSWWIDWPQFVEEFGRQPHDLREYCAWSQERQKTALVIAARECKKRFPACGGFLLWMGHDSFPCTANTSIIDFLGRPKAAALGLGQVFHTTPENLRQEND